MAEAVARHHASDVIEASSAGLAPLGYIVEPTIDVLLGSGYSTEYLSSKRLSRQAIDGADLIVNLSGYPIDCLPDHMKVEEWPVEDPYGTDPENYRRILEEIENRVLALATRFRPRIDLENSSHA